MVLVQKWRFFQIFFLGNIGQDDVFYNILERKNGPCTLRPIYFFIFATKTEKGHITYPYHISIFQSTEKKRKKENGQ